MRFNEAHRVFFFSCVRYYKVYKHKVMYGLIKETLLINFINYIFFSFFFLVLESCCRTTVAFGFRFNYP